MKKLLILLLLISSVCGADSPFGPFDPGAVRKTDYTTDQALKMDTDGSNAADLVDLPNRVRAVFASVTADLEVGGDVKIEGDITGVNASFTGDVSAGGVDLMKNDGSNSTPEFAGISIDRFLAVPLIEVLGTSSVTIPSTYGGRTVYSIGDNAFNPTESPFGALEGTITIPSSVKNIGASAFRNNPLVTSVVLPENVFITARAFRDCGITSLTIPAGTVLDVGTGMAFMNNNITELTYLTTERQGWREFYGNPIASITIVADADITAASGAWGDNGDAFVDYYIGGGSLAGNYLWDGTAWTGPF